MKLKEVINMAVQRLSAFEKTAIQARHSIKRLEVFADIARTDEEAETAKLMIEHFKAIRSLVPNQELDVDLKDKE